MQREPEAGEDPRLIVRSARESDLPAVVALDAEATGQRKAAYWRERFRWFVGDHRDRFFLIAQRGGKDLGFIVGEIRAWEFGSPPCGWIFAINVAPSERLLGLGSALYDAICAKFRRAGVETVRTSVAMDSESVLAFFRSHGLRAGSFVQLEGRLSR